MKAKTFNKVNLALIVALIVAIASVSSAAQQSAQKPTAKEIKKKTAEAADAIKNYSVDQRDEALKKAKAVLDDLDTRIDGLESRLNEKWDRMDQSARKKATATLAGLRKQRNGISQWYGELKRSSGNAWEDVKKGFLKSYQELRDTFDKVRSEF
jgi:small-conductance mechanosensitive channel